MSFGNSNFGFSGAGSGGGGGTITGGGTLNYFAIFTPSGTSIGDSLMNQVSNPDDPTVTSVQIAADLIPDSTLNSRKLGASTRRWDTLFMASNIDYSSDLLFNSGGSQYFRMSTSGDFFLADNKNIDVENVGSKILNIGLQNATVINIGTGITPKTINVGSATTLLDNINIYGNIFSQEVTNLLVKDKLFTVNDGGAVASGFNAGFQIDEGGVNTGWFMTNSTRNGWEFKAPSITGIATLDLSVITTDRTYTLPDSTGTFALESYVIANFLPLTLTSDTSVNLNTYNLTFDGGANTARVILNATNATDAKIFSFRTSGSQRWAFRVDGANDNFALRRYDNTGTFIDAPISVDRTNGDVVIDNSLYAPLIIGGTAVGSVIQYKGTTANGTSTVAAHQFLVGNDGATTAAQIFNSGQISIGNYASPTNLRLVTVGQDTAYISFGSLIGTTSRWAFYGNQAAPSATNYFLNGTNNQTALNAVQDVLIKVADATKFNIDTVSTVFNQTTTNSGAITPFSWTMGNNTNQTASTEITNYKFNGSTKTWLTGAITNQRWTYFTANTAAFASPSTITNSYGLYVEAAVEGTNATITNNFALGLSGSLSLVSAGNGIYIKEGSNATMGVETIVYTGGGLYQDQTVNTTKVTANSRIFLTVQSTSETGTTNIPIPFVLSRVNGTSFTIRFTSDVDATYEIAWIIIEPS